MEYLILITAMIILLFLVFIVMLGKLSDRGRILLFKNPFTEEKEAPIRLIIEEENSRERCTISLSEERLDISYGNNTTHVTIDLRGHNRKRQKKIFCDVIYKMIS